MDDKFIQALHSELSSSYELGTVEEFGKKLASDDVFRKALFDDASKTLDLGDYAAFEGQVKKKLSTEDYLPTFDNLSKSFQKRQKDKEPFSVVPPQTKQVKYEDTLPEDVTIDAVNKADKSRMDYLSGEAKKIEAGVIERVRQEATALSEKYEGAELEKKLDDLYELRSGEMQKAVETLAGETQYKYIDKDVKNYSDLFGNILDSNNTHEQKVQQIATLRQQILNSLPEEGRSAVKGELNRLISDLSTQSPMGQQFLLKTSVATTRNKLIAAHDKLKAETDKKLQAAGIDPNAIATAPPMVEKEVDELSRLQGAIDFMNRALDVPESKEGAIGDAFKSELGNILTAGVSGLLESLEVMQSARRENPTEADKALVDAYGQLQQLQGMASENVDRYRRAKSLVGSIPYMEQFLLTGGVGDFASATAKKVGESVLKKGIKKRIAQAAVKRVVEPVTEGAISMIGRVPIMPMTYKNIAEAGVALKEEDGKFVVDPAQMPTIGEAIGKGVYKSATEVFSESLGGVFALPKWKWVDKIITPSAKKLFTRVGMQNPFGEYGEEIFANLFQGEKIDRQFLGDLLMTIPIMTGGFAVLTTPAIVSDLKMAKKKVPNAPEVERLIEAKNEQGLLDMMTEAVTGKPKSEAVDIIEGVGAMVQENVADEMTAKVEAPAEKVVGKNGNTYTPEILIRESGKDKVRVLDDKGEEASSLTLRTVDVDGEKYWSVIQLATATGEENNGLATAVYRQALNNLPEGYAGIISPGESRINKTEVPRIHQKLAAEFDMEVKENGDIVFKRPSGASNIAPRIEGKTESGTQVSPEGDMPALTTPSVLNAGEIQGDVIPVKRISELREQSHTKGVFADETGKLYKSVEIKGGETIEHEVIAQNQDLSIMPAVGNIRNTSEGRAFEIERLSPLEEEDNITLDEYRAIVADAKKLDDRNIFVSESPDLARDKNGAVKLLDFSMSRNKAKAEKGDTNYSSEVLIASDAYDHLSQNDKNVISHENEIGRKNKLNKITKKDTPVETKGFLYSLTARPFAKGTFPEDGFVTLVSENDKKKDGSFGVMEFKRPLSQREVDKYELRFDGRSENSYPAPQTQEEVPETTNVGEGVGVTKTGETVAKSATKTESDINVELNKESSHKKEEGFSYDVNWYDIKNQQGDIVGNIVLLDRGDYYQVQNAKVETPRKGIGLAAYKQLIAQLDKPLYSDTSMTQPAHGLWNKLVAEGLAEQFKENIGSEKNPNIISRYRTIAETAQVESRPTHPLTEKEFNKKYKAQHKNIRSKTPEEQEATLRKIQEEGFKSEYINALPISRGGKPQTIVDRNYGNKKGDVVYLVPKEWVRDTPNGYKVKNGWKPESGDVVTIEYDGQPTYEAYLNAQRKNIATPQENKATPLKVEEENKAIPLNSKRLKESDFSGLNNRPLNKLDQDNRSAISYLNNYPSHFIGVTEIVGEGAEKITGITPKGAAQISKVSEFALELRFLNPSTKIASSQVMHFNTQDALDAAIDKIYEFTRKPIQEPEVSTLREQEANVEQTPPPVEPPTAETTEQPEGKERTILRRVIDASNVPQEVKDELIAQGIEYIPRGRRFTHAEAQELISVFGSTEGGIDKLFAKVKDLSNGILPDTRTILNVYVAEQYSKQLDKAEDVKTREQLRKKVADAYMIGAELATMHGQAVEAQKKWQEILARDPEVIITTKKRRQSENNKDALKAMEGDVKASEEFLTENIANSDEFKKILEERVSEEIDKIANKKYGKVDKKKIDDFFDSLLIKTDKAFDATIGIPIAAYNGAILVIKKAVLTGVDIANAVAQGVEYINNWYKEKYDKGEIPSPDWNKDDYMAVMPERLKPLTKMVKKVRYKLPKKAEDTIVDKLYDKMATATKPQLRRLVREYVATLEEEGAVSSDRFKDLFAKAIGLEVLSVEDEQTIRLAGQSINYARKKADTLMDAFNDYLKEAEQETPDKARLAEIEADIRRKKKDANKARFAAQKAAQQLDKLLQEELELGQTLSTLIQGNLLTPISLMSNIIGNTTFLPVRGAARMVASALDNMVYGLAKAYTPLVKKIDPQKHPRLARLANGLPTPTRIYRNFASLRGFAIGFKHGSIEGAIQLYTGQLSEDIYRREASRGLEPVKAAMRFYNQLTGKEQARFDKLLSDFLEAMPAGYFAEGFFRALNLGDKPFRRAAETARLYEIAQIKGLRGKAKEAFLSNPDADTLEEMRKAGELSVYQQDNIVSDLMKYLSQKLNKVNASKEHKRRSIVAKTLGSLAKATTMPFVKTPTNLIAEAFEYAIPVVTAARGVYAMKNGDRRKATDLFGKAIVGQMFVSLAVYLLKSGLLTPPPDDDDKIRQAQYEGKRGYSFNPDAAYRAMTGGDPTWQDKDRVWSYQRLGVPSMMLMGVAKAYADVPQDKVTDLSYMERSIAMLPGIASGALDQSFLTGVSTALTAWMEGEAKFNDWFINTTKALSAAVYPNTIAQLSQTFFSDNYIREVRDMYSEDERLKRRMVNTFKDRMFMAQDLPTKVTIWGEDVKRIPEGRSWPYMFFDVTKGTKYQRTTFGVKMYEMYERYRLIDEEEAKNIIPSLPSATVEVGWDKRNMTAMEVNELQKKVGTLRRMYVERLMSSEEWMDMTDEERITELQSIYRDASTKVKSEMFMLDIVKASDKWEFLRANDFIPVPTSSITINGKRITGEEAANFYDQVQRLFVLELGGMPDGKVSDDMREDYKKDVEKAWARAKKDVTNEWRDKIPEPEE